MVAPVAAVVGKKAASKAVDNPGTTIFLAVLAGAVLLQGLKNLPNLGEWGWNQLVPFDVTKPFDVAKESVLETWEQQSEITESFEEITPAQDPLERLIFGDFSGALGPDEEEQFGFWQTGYRGARTGLFTGLSSPWAP